MTPEEELNYKLERLLAIKIQMKELDAEAKKLSSMILSQPLIDPPKQFISENGKLLLIARENWKVTDNFAVADTIGDTAFITYATITKAKIQKAIGETGILALIKKGALKFTNISYYYKLER